MRIVRTIIFLGAIFNVINGEVLARPSMQQLFDTHRQEFSYVSMLKKPFVNLQLKLDQFLQQGGDINETIRIQGDQQNPLCEITLLLYAACNWNLDLVNYLLTHGARPDIVFPKKNFPCSACDAILQSLKHLVFEPYWYYQSEESAVFMKHKVKMFVAILRVLPESYKHQMFQSMIPMLEVVNMSASEQLSFVIDRIVLCRKNEQIQDLLEELQEGFFDRSVNSLTSQSDAELKTTLSIIFSMEKIMKEPQNYEDELIGEIFRDCCAVVMSDMEILEVLSNINIEYYDIECSDVREIIEEFLNSLHDKDRILVRLALKKLVRDEQLLQYIIG